MIAMFFSSPISILSYWNRFPVWQKKKRWEVKILVVCLHNKSTSCTERKKVSNLPLKWPLKPIFSSFATHIISLISLPSCTDDQNEDMRFKSYRFLFTRACCFLTFAQVFHKDEKLSEFFKIVSTSNDRKGKPFISTMEGNLPKSSFFLRLQWKKGRLII